jgi:hypothetical protein
MKQISPIEFVYLVEYPTCNTGHAYRYGHDFILDEKTNIKGEYSIHT